MGQVYVLRLRNKKWYVGYTERGSIDRILEHIEKKGAKWTKKYPPLKGNIKEIKTAVLWKKKVSTFEPDFCAEKLNSNPWIVQPFEHYEEIRVEDLVKKHGS